LDRIAGVDALVNGMEALPFPALVRVLLSFAEACYQFAAADGERVAVSLSAQSGAAAPVRHCGSSRTS
jgi:hypothetical protein